MIFEFITLFVLLFIIIGLVYQFLYDLYLWVLFLSILFYLCYIAVKLVYYYKKKKETAPETIPLQQTISVKKELPKITDKDLERLKNFINKNLKQGFQASIIKEALVKQGWPKEKVEQALKETT